jgi:nucleoid-associated protein YgaU
MAVNRSSRGSSAGGDSSYPIKARIKLAKGNADTDVVIFHFNPERLSISESENTPQDCEGQKEKRAEVVSLSGPSARTLTVSKAIFDTSGRPNDPDYLSDVTKTTQKVFALLRADTPKSRPPKVKFVWADFVFTSIVSNVSEELTLFTPKGVPIRAELTITFREVTDSSATQGQNPTSRGDARAVHTVLPGETIDSIAYQTLGDARKWAVVAEFNRLENPFRLRPGQKLAIPVIR